jgi:hypothetical protein
VRIVVGSLWECEWTVFLSNGQIVVEGSLNDATVSHLAIIGGTGIYKGVRGQVDVTIAASHFNESYQIITNATSPQVNFTLNHLHLANTSFFSLGNTLVAAGSNASNYGDRLVLSGSLVDASNNTTTYQGSCILSELNQLWECEWTTFLSQGQIVARGPFYQTGSNSTLAIVGGTGLYSSTDHRCVC